jgi:tagaturonate reductase
MSKLNKTLLNNNILSKNIKSPIDNWDKLPEKVLQFGTGVLLRGLPDYFIDKANRQDVFNGRVVVVKSTNRGGTDEFAEQDGLYTIHNKGIQNGKEIQETIIVSAISRVLSASEQWEEILAVGISSDLEVVISNTTEVGIVLKENDSLSALPPDSFPAKLTAVLHKRFIHFNGDSSKGLVILPTELISDNGIKLKEIVLKLAQINKLGEDFINWLNTANYFCNTLVDRIVPGKLPLEEQVQADKELGYADDLAIMTEPFRLWAIESDDARVSEILSFAKVDDGVVIAPNIWKFKELKLRLLNGSHTFSCALAILCGFETVKEAMQNEDFLQYLRSLMNDEIVKSIVGDEISEKEALNFASSVVDRFSNPFLNHQWLSISFNFTSKMEMRNAALLGAFAQKYQSVPQHMALGFAAYLRFMKCEKNKDGDYAGVIGNKSYILNDADAPLFASLWASQEPKELVNSVLNNEVLWKRNLNEIPRLADDVLHYLQLLQSKDALDVIKQLNNQKVNN